MIRPSNKLLLMLLLPLLALLVPAGRAACTYTLSPANRTHGYGTATNTVNLTTSNGCSWTVVNLNDWITFTTPASGIATNTITTNVYTISANPNPIARTGLVQIAGQTLTISQNPVICSYSLSPVTRTHGYGFTTGTVNVATSGGCPWTVTNTSSWISILSGTNGLGSSTVTYTVNDNVSASWRTGLVFVADQSCTVIQRPTPCLYEIVPASRVLSQGAATGLISVTATAGCGWSVSNANSWITITSGASGTGNGSVIYSAAANPSGMGRTGLVMIADQLFTLSQLGLPCSNSISPASQSYGWDSGTGLVTVTTTPGCSWITVNTNSWITLTSPANGTDNGSVAYSVAMHLGPGVRTGVIVIAGRTFTVSQTGLGCSFKLSPTNRVHGYAAATNFLTLTTSNTCPWDVVNTNSWILITSGASGVGSNIVSYTIDPNPSPDDRTGVVLIDGQSFTLTQHGVVCSFSISPGGRTHGPGAASNYVSVSTSSGCPWTALISNSWITLVSGTGTGAGTVGYLVESNPDSWERVGTVTIGDQSLVLTQRAATCSYSIAPSSETHGFTAETGLVAVTAIGGCAWTVSNTNDWITITSATNGTGSGSVTYQLSVNSSASPRSGELLIAGEPFTVTQLAMVCAYKLSPTNRTHGFGATTNSVSVIASNGCAWSIVNTNGWITLTSGLSGSGSAPATYAVDPNFATSDRMGVVLIGGQSLMLTQRGVGCNVSLAPSARNHGNGATSNSFAVSTGTNCAWTATTTNNWITVVLNPGGTGNAIVGYTVEPNPSGIARSGAVLVGDQALVLFQNGAPCTYAILPASGAHSAGLETGVVSVTAVSGCAWSVSNSNDWITIQSDSNGVGVGTVKYSVAANPTVSSRTGMVMVADGFYAVIQAGLPTACTYRLSPTNRTHGYGATANSISLITESGCSWTVLNTNDWIMVTSLASGVSGATVNYTVEPNPNLDDRTGVLLIGGQPFILTQRGLSCSYSISPTSRTHGFSATTGTVSVTVSSGCSWTVSNTNNWITILSGASGTGNGSFAYTLPGNFNPSQRTGLVMVADQTLTMVQRAATNGFVFETIALQTVGQSKLRLAGAPAGVWRLQGSSNLVDWVNLSNITNITGVVEYTDTTTTNGNIRFYRAVQP